MSDNDGKKTLGLRRFAPKQCEAKLQPRPHQERGRGNQTQARCGAQAGCGKIQAAPLVAPLVVTHPNVPQGFRMPNLSAG